MDDQSSFDYHCMAAAASIINVYGLGILNSDSLAPETRQFLWSILNIYAGPHRERFVQIMRLDQQEIETVNDQSTQTRLEDSISDLMRFEQILPQSPEVEIQPEPEPEQPVLIDLGSQTDPISLRSYGTTTNQDWVTTRGTQCEPQRERTPDEPSNDGSNHDSTDGSNTNGSLSDSSENSSGGSSNDEPVVSSNLNERFINYHIYDNASDEEERPVCYNNNSDIELFIESVTEPEIEPLECPVEETQVELNRSTCETPMHFNYVVSPPDFNGSSLPQFDVDDINPPEYQSTPVKLNGKYYKY